MLTQNLKKLFIRDLTNVKNEIGLYTTEKAIWLTDKNILNPAGNLCLHLIGNLNSFIGAQLGGTGYVRQRDLEFSLKDIPRTALLENIDKTLAVLNDSFDKLSDEDLDREYPLAVFGEKTSTQFFLIHLAMHLSYHLGQINYHRRLLDI